MKKKQEPGEKEEQPGEVPYTEESLNANVLPTLSVRFTSTPADMETQKVELTASGWGSKDAIDLFEHLLSRLDFVKERIPKTKNDVPKI